MKLINKEHWKNICLKMAGDFSNQNTNLRNRVLQKLRDYINQRQNNTIKKLIFQFVVNWNDVRTESSHEIYNNTEKPLLRPVTVDSNYPEVPILHIKTNLRTIGMSSKEFEEILKNL